MENWPIYLKNLTLDHMYMAYMAMFFNVIRGGNFHIVGDLNRVGSLEDISDK